MKIVSLQLSNILSFRYVDDIANAEKINFDDDLNIIIGENGSGKSTALEVINFIFRRVFYKQYNLNQDLYVRIPRQSGHRFHANLDSDSTANWTLIPGQTGQSAVAA